MDKMDQKWIQPVLVILLVCHIVCSDGAVVAEVVKEGESVEIKCRPADMGSMIIWFRVLDDSDMEFIGSFSSTGTLKDTNTPFSPDFGHSKMDRHILTVKSFSRARHTGSYSCGSIKSNELKFGEVTRLMGEKQEEVVTRAPAVVTQRSPPATTKACVCPNHQEESSLPLFCSPLILGPVAGGCGLLLLLLIVAVLYCNRIRTRRCPHHNKRKPRTMAPQKQMMTNRRA